MSPEPTDPTPDHPRNEGSQPPQGPGEAAAPAPSPYGEPAPSPYGEPAQSPYGAPTPNPYAPPTPNPYGASPQNPYGGQPGYGYPPAGYAVNPPQDGLGIAALVVGIVSLVGLCFYGLGLLGGIAAIVMGKISMNRIDASNGQLRGRELAKAGFILGIVSVAIGAILLVLVVALFAFGGVVNTSFGP